MMCPLLWLRFERKDKNRDNNKERNRKKNPVNQKKKINVNENENKMNNDKFLINAEMKDYRKINFINRKKIFVGDRWCERI